MSRIMIIVAVLVLLVPSSVAISESQGASDDEAMRLAEQITEKGARTFDSRDAAAMAASYLPDAQVFLVGKSEGRYNVTVRRGSADIQALYEDVFQEAETIRSRNIVEMARLLQPDLLVIYGTFEIERGTQTSRFPFFQVRIKQGDDWLISSLRLFLVPES